MIVALWRAPGADVTIVHDVWAPKALAAPSVEACTVSFADGEQGTLTGEHVDVLIALGLTRAHDLDDVPERDILYSIAREVNVWRVDVHRPITWERTWPDGEYAPGVTRVSFVQRAEGLTHEQFVRHWREQHAPLARVHHAGLADYTQNVVRRAYTPGGAGVDGIAQLRFRTRADLEERFYDSDEGKAIIRADVARFIARRASTATVMRELPLRTA